MRAQFGKVNTLHTHAMPTADRPLVTENLVGGEEGCRMRACRCRTSCRRPRCSSSSPARSSRARRTSSRVSSAPSSTTSAACAPTAISPRTRTSTSARRSRSARPTSARLTTLPAGVMPTTLEQAACSASTRRSAIGRCAARSTGGSTLRTELIWSRQDLPAGDADDGVRLLRPGRVSVRAPLVSGRALDRSGRTLDGSLHDNGGSFFLTFWPTEFSQIRGQYRLHQLRRRRHAPTSSCSSSILPSARTARTCSDDSSVMTKDNTIMKRFTFGALTSLALARGGRRSARGPRRRRRCAS